MTLVAVRRPLSSTAWASPAQGGHDRHQGGRHQPGGDTDGQGPAGGRHPSDQPPVEGCTHQCSSPPVVR